MPITTIHGFNDKARGSCGQLPLENLHTCTLQAQFAQREIYFSPSFSKMRELLQFNKLKQSEWAPLEKWLLETEFHWIKIKRGSLLSNLYSNLLPAFFTHEILFQIKGCCAALLTWDAAKQRKIYSR